ncbi:hypothetical protein SNE40_006007 [Patella caerulea]|uniref:Uncharacterized protein n=1 Tax=Patella caerulea TaxID=87958 RepID=A0AAN8K1P5_PATCE
MPEKEKSTFEIHLMIASVTVMVLTCFIIGIVVCRYKCRSHKHERPRRASDTTNDMRHSYISLNSVFIFHANHESTTTSAESTASNGTDDDTDAYANPYDPVNRDGIDTSKNFYMSLQNPGASNINHGEDVQEKEIDDNSVNNINDVQTADDDDDGDDDDDDDDISTHDSSPYDALNKSTMNRDVHSYLSLQPCTSIEDDVKIVKKRPSTI